MSELICFSCGKALKIEDFYFNPEKADLKLCPNCFTFWKHEKYRKYNTEVLE